jgi:hypothetical protein
MQGIFPIQPFFRKICLEYMCDFSCLRDNSLSGEQGIFSRVQGIHSALWTGAGNWGAKSILEPRRIQMPQRVSPSRIKKQIAIV